MHSVGGDYFENFAFIEGKGSIEQDRCGRLLKTGTQAIPDWCPDHLTLLATLKIIIGLNTNRL